MESQTLTSFHFEDFCNLDKSPHADFLIESMKVMLSLPTIQSIKQRSIEVLNIQKGEKILEVGCGLGEDAEAIGYKVGHTGQVIAIDNSEKMLKEAIQKSLVKSVIYKLDDAHHLSFKNDFFDACHTDRLLVSQKKAHNIIEELIRVIKPGGQISITEVDPLSITLYPYNKNTQVILEQINNTFVNPYMGRQLPSLLIDNGLENLTVIPEILMIRSYSTLRKIFPLETLFTNILENHLLTKEELLEWDKDMEQADKKGKLLYTVNFFIVVGSKPLYPWEKFLHDT